MALEGGEGGEVAAPELDQDLGAEDALKAKKKKESGADKLQVMKQFKKIAAEFQSKAATEGTKFKVQNKMGVEQVETAGMLKKKTKKKKEKTLGAKLRMKEKKNK
jgi:hypothetical protein